MSVRVPDRGQSKADFIHNAIRLRKEVTELLLRDFGIKGKVYDEIKTARIDEATHERFLRVIGHYAMRETDRRELEDIICNCSYDEKTIEQYPTWLIDYFRKSILRCLEALMNNLYLGNSIYITGESEYQKRREHWNAAIGCVYSMAGWLDYVRQTLPVDANKYDRYLDRCQREIDMLRGIKKADNAIINGIRKKKGNRA